MLKILKGFYKKAEKKFSERKFLFVEEKERIARLEKDIEALAKLYTEMHLLLNKLCAEEPRPPAALQISGSSDLLCPSSLKAYALLNRLPPVFCRQDVMRANVMTVSMSDYYLQKWEKAGALFRIGQGVYEKTPKFKRIHS